MSETLKCPLLTCFLTDVSGVNMFATRKVISCHISPMIKEAEYRFPMVSTIFPNQKSKCWTLDKNAITMLNKTLTRGVIFSICCFIERYLHHMKENMCFVPLSQD